MKNTISLLILLLAASTATAQPLSTAWFAGVGGGLAAHDNGAFSNRLKSYTPVRDNGENYIYQTEDFSTAGMTLNAEAGLLFGGSFVVGASAEQVSYPVVRSINAPGNPRDEYRLAAEGGGLDLGFAAVNDAGMVVYPHLHIGYYGYTLDYTNNQADSIPFFEGKPVSPGTTATYSGSALRAGIGVSMVKLIGVDGESSTGGLTLVARLAWGVMPTRPHWEEPDGSEVNNGGLTPAYNGVSLSISIGGGMGWK